VSHEGDAYHWFQRGTALLASRDYRPAAAAFERAKALEPESASIREGLARACLSSRQYERAASELRTLVELAPTNHYAHYCLARALSRLGDARLAARHRKLARHLGSTLA